MGASISVMIPTFNCAHLLRCTLESVLSQLGSDHLCEIVVVDDYSTKDDPTKVVTEVGRGQVRFHRQEQNVGAIRNFNTCIRLARGDLIHILHGDDFVLPGFYAAIGAAAERHKATGLFCTRTFIVDEPGEIENLSPRLQQLESPTNDPWPLIRKGNVLYTPSVVIRRSVYEQTGAFNEALVHVADWEMWVRAVAAHGGLCLNKPLAAYRVFAGQDTARLQRTGENVRDSIRLCDIWSKLLPGFDPAAFLRMIEGTAKWQTDNFYARGMMDAAAANARVLDEIRSKLRFLSSASRS
jgi:glycosyltransferase involved in cell wall biosynthesis